MVSPLKKRPLEKFQNETCKKGRCVTATSFGSSSGSVQVRPVLLPSESTLQNRCILPAARITGNCRGFDCWGSAALAPVGTPGFRYSGAALLQMKALPVRTKKHKSSSEKFL